MSALIDRSMFLASCYSYILSMLRLLMGTQPANAYEIQEHFQTPDCKAYRT